MSSSHYARDLAEDRADAGRNTRHDSASGNCHKARHQCILNEVLSSGILPNFQFQNQIRNFCHVFLSLATESSIAIGKLSPEAGTGNQG